MYALLSLLSGILLTLAFAPFGWWPLGLVALTSISLVWLNPHFNRPMRYGFLFGLGNFASGVYWVYISLYQYGGASLFFAILANVVLVLYLSLYPMLVGAFLQWFSRPASLYRALLIPLLWMAGEWLRANLLTGFPWLSIGYTQIDGFLRGIAPLAGTFGVGLVLMFICALLGYSLCRSKIWPVIVCAFLAVMSYATETFIFTREFDSPFSVALVQGNVEQHNKFNAQQMTKDLEDYIGLTSQREESVIIWPETAIAFTEQSVRDPILNPLDSLYSQKGQTVLTGIITQSDNGGQYYNSVITLGDGMGRYSKDHLLPFGEFIPLRSVLGFFNNYVDIPMSDFARGGTKQEPVLTNGIPVGISICFEAAFGRVVRHGLLADAQYLVNVSNDGWFQNSIAADQHLQMNQMRTLEFDRDMARATNNGITAIINHQGQIVEKLPRFEQSVLSGWIQPRIGLTPYARWGNAIFAYGLLLYAIIMCLIYPIRNHNARALSRQPD